MIPGVPYDAEIEYLESGTSTNTYILPEITGAEMYNGGGIVVDFSFTYQQQWTPVARISNDRNLNFVGIDNNIPRLYTRFNDIFTGTYFSQFGLENSVSAILGLKIHTSARNGVCSITVNGITKSYTYTQLCKNTADQLRLFTDGASWGAAKFRVWRAKIYANGDVLVRDLIPVRVGQIGYMYDRITKRLFGNKGTGSFVLGPDVAKPVMGLWGMRKVYTADDYIKDGLVSMWDGIENAGWGKHNADATVWKDLAGSMDLPFTGAASIHDRYVEGDGTSWVAGLAGSSNVIPLADCRTLECVSSFRTVAGYPNYHHVCVFSSNSGATAYRVLLNDNNTSDGKAKLVSSAVSSFGNQLYIADYTPSVDSIIAVSTVYPTTAAKAERMYRDGVAVSTATGVNRSVAAGTYIFGTGKTSSTLRGNTIGKAYCFRVYNRALSPAEITHNYQIDKARFNL